MYNCSPSGYPKPYDAAQCHIHRRVQQHDKHVGGEIASPPLHRARRIVHVQQTAPLPQTGMSAQTEISGTERRLFVRLRFVFRLLIRKPVRVVGYLRDFFLGFLPCFEVLLESVSGEQIRLVSKMFQRHGELGIGCADRRE